MSKIIHIKPAPGVRVLDPDTIPPAPLPPEGKRVVQTPYWLRRIVAGEVVLVQTPQPPDNDDKGAKTKKD